VETNRAPLVSSDRQGPSATEPADKKWIVGVDLGGTNIVVGVLPIDGGTGEVLA
jgi:hypothetical protein